MVYSQLLQFYTQSASLRGALYVLLILGFAPLMSSSTAFAQGEQEVTQPAMVNINTADARSLAAGLKGIGQSRANDIVRYRETYGPFSSVEALTEVKGVGKSTIEKNRHVLTLE